MKPAQPKFLITLVRHGETFMNTQKLLQGHSDTPLSQIGVDQAKNLGKKTNAKFTKAYSSDLQRAHNTANIILNEMPTQTQTPTVIKDTKLRERGYGDAEGKPIREFIERAEKKKISISDFVPHGGESTDEVRKRVADFFDNLCALSSSTTDDENILVVSHGGWIQSLMRYLNGNPTKYRLKNFSSSEAIRIHHNTGVTVMQISPQGNEDLIKYDVNFIKINNIVHLK